MYSHATNSELISDIAFSHGGTAAGSVAKTFDVWNGVDLIETRLADNTPVARADYELDARGRRRERTEADGTRWEFVYNTRDEVAGGVRKSADDEAVPGWEFGYEFDGIGNRLTSSEASSGSIYTPNNLNQIAALDRPGVWHLRGEALPEATVTVNDTPVTRTGALFHKVLSFDNSASALLPEAFVSSVLPGENPGDPDRVDERTGTRYIPKASATLQYDLDGNLINDGRWTYEWDAESRLVAMQKLPGNEDPMRLEFTYDYQSRRIKSTKKIWDTGTSSFIIHTSTFFLWDGWMMLGEVTTTEGSTAPPTTKSYLWGIDLSGSEEGAGTVGGLLAAWIDSHPHIIAEDASGNITAAINATTQTVSARYDYAPFGEPLRATGPIATTLPFRWSSKYTDNESGLVYYDYRFYDPLTGRWISRDPIEEQGGVNLYGYVSNIPMSLIDPLGLDFIAVGSNAAIRGIPAEVGGHLAIAYWKESPYCIQEGDQKSGGVGSGKWKRGKHEVSNTAIFAEVIELHFKKDFQTTYTTTIGGNHYIRDVERTDKVAVSRVSHRTDTDNADIFVVVYADTKDQQDAAQKWRAVVNAAQSYRYAEHGPFVRGQAAHNWPNSQYGNLISGNSNNSNTFIRYLARSIGRSADVIPGRAHPGNTTPQPVRDNRPAPIYVGD